MSKRTAFSRKSEQRHWHLRHEQEEAERQRRRMRKLAQRKDNVRAGDQYTARADEQANQEWGGDTEN